MAMNKREREHVERLERENALLQAQLYQVERPEPLAEPEGAFEAIVGYYYNLYRALHETRPSGQIELAATRGNAFYSSSEKEHVRKFLAGQSYGSRGTHSIYRSRKQALQAMRNDVQRAMAAKLADIDEAIAAASDDPLIFGE